MSDNRIRLLLVDDEVIFRRNVARLLKARGLAAEQAESGEKCLAFLAKNPMDVVVLDVKMPGMNGIETLGRIKKAYPQTEVILLTGQVSAEDGVEGLKSGAYDYLSKPVDIDHLVGKIRQAHEKIRLEEAHRKETEFRVKMQEQMVAAERLAALGTLAAGVAHEINNPLAIMRQTVQWMKLRLQKHAASDSPAGEDIEKGLEKIETAIERARRITHQLLGSVRENDGVVSEIDVGALIADAVQLVRSTASEGEIDIVTQVDPGLKSIWSDPGGLRQVITNLLINAVQAAAKAGQITVKVQDSGTEIALYVVDSGIGIPEENLNRIFEPFFTTKPPGEGTGLGLFVVRGILDSLGGTITVDSQLGQGTRFCVRLPKTHKNHGG